MAEGATILLFLVDGLHRHGAASAMSIRRILAWGRRGPKSRRAAGTERDEVHLDAG